MLMVGIGSVSGVEKVLDDPGVGSRVMDQVPVASSQTILWPLSGTREPL